MLTLCFSILLLSLVKAYPDGAPTSACQSMTPNHGSHKPQEHQGEFVITVERTDNGIMGNLMISNPDVKPFEGWQLQAREMGSDTIVGGSFDPSVAPNMAAKGLSCLRSGGSNDTLTHTGKGCASGEGSSSSMSSSHEESMSGESTEDSESTSMEEGSVEDGGGSHAGGEGYLDSLPFMWTPPEGYSGDIRFVATVVQGFKMFFVGIESEVITI